MRERFHCRLGERGHENQQGTWNARDSEAELSADAKKEKAEGNNIKDATFLKGKVFPPGHEGGIKCMAAWPVAYRIETARDWLFAQTNSPQAK